MSMKSDFSEQRKTNCWQIIAFSNNVIYSNAHQCIVTIITYIAIICTIMTIFQVKSWHVCFGLKNLDMFSFVRSSCGRVWFCQKSVTIIFTYGWDKLHRHTKLKKRLDAFFSMNVDALNSNLKKELRHHPLIFWITKNTITFYFLFSGLVSVVGSKRLTRVSPCNESEAKIASPLSSFFFFIAKKHIRILDFGVFYHYTLQKPKIVRPKTLYTFLSESEARMASPTFSLFTISRWFSR